ncbi:hypothetical protein HQ560_18715 [bacterium]|nr:hypothetical protein [bacterium]
MRRLLLLLGMASLALVLTGCGPKGDPALPPVDPDGPAVAIRPENLVVLPATGPVTHVLVQNLQNKTFEGTLSLACPPGWKLDATTKPLVIPPRQLVRVPFKIEKGIDAEPNRYAITATAEGAGATVVWDKPVAAATTPYYKPVIDGKIEDWADAVPVTFTTQGKLTSISTYWSGRAYSILVSVEEKDHDPTKDAVQFAISPARAVTPRYPYEPSQRYEFLIVNGRCHLLMTPGVDSAAGQMKRELAKLELPSAQVAVSRVGNVTHYECAIPLRAMPTIRAEPGREYCMSVLVHDSDSDLRDLGRAVGLWAWQQNPLAWSQWPNGMNRGHTPYDNKIEWGFCSSKR